MYKYDCILYEYKRPRHTPGRTRCSKSRSTCSNGSGSSGGAAGSRRARYPGVTRGGAIAAAAPSFDSLSRLPFASEVEVRVALVLEGCTGRARRPTWYCAIESSVSRPQRTNSAASRSTDSSNSVTDSDGITAASADALFVLGGEPVAAARLEFTGALLSSDI